jgi:hypothetical protein
MSLYSPMMIFAGYYIDLRAIIIINFYSSSFWFIDFCPVVLNPIHSLRIMSAPFSPIIIVGAFVLPLVSFGITEASRYRELLIETV